MEKIYIRYGYTDMRKQLNGLLDIIQYNFKLAPYSNSLFLFCGKRSIMREMAFVFYTNSTKQVPPTATNRQRSKTDF